MGKVKLAQHNTTHEICAVKIIPRAAKLYQRAHANDPPPQTTQEAAQRHKEFEKKWPETNVPSVKVRWVDCCTTHLFVDCMKWYL